MPANVLVVDDEPEILDLASSVLRNAGYEVQCCGNGVDALPVLEGPAEIALLFTDVVMPGKINGFALARMARLRRSRLKVLYTTGYPVPEHEAQTAFGPILAKPYLPSQLLAAVRKLIGSASDASGDPAPGTDGAEKTYG